MSREGHLDQKTRAAEKAASRHRDAADLIAGRVTREELALRNDFFGALDLSRFQIIAVGSTEIAAAPCEVVIHDFDPYSA